VRRGRQNCAQHRACHADADACRQGFGRRAEIRPREIRATSLRHGLAYRQKHPHVHLVVKAENEIGQRLHIDTQRLREWHEDFARLMREQGIAAQP